MVYIIMFQCLFLVYNHCGYIEIVRGLAEESMQKAVDEVQGLEMYSSAGEIILFIQIAVLSSYIILVGHN